ncbi:hypothetical protein AX16_005788 [Volvariella volvacea WC 439]|nr:hypothetical protein AX16_005788 [Volvariella volvacea WC 439]
MLSAPFVITRQPTRGPTMGLVDPCSLEDLEHTWQCHQAMGEKQHLPHCRLYKPKLGDSDIHPHHHYHPHQCAHDSSSPHIPHPKPSPHLTPRVFRLVLVLWAFLLAGIVGITLAVITDLGSGSLPLAVMAFSFLGHGADAGGRCTISAAAAAAHGASTGSVGSFLGKRQVESPSMVTVTPLSTAGLSASATVSATETATAAASATPGSGEDTALNLGVVVAVVFGLLAAFVMVLIIASCKGAGSRHPCHGCCASGCQC